MPYRFNNRLFSVLAFGFALWFVFFSAFLQAFHYHPEESDNLGIPSKLFHIIICENDTPLAQTLGSNALEPQTGANSDADCPICMFLAHYSTELPLVSPVPCLPELQIAPIDEELTLCFTRTIFSPDSPRAPPADLILCL